MEDFKKPNNTIEPTFQPERKPKYGKVYLRKSRNCDGDAKILEELPDILFSNQDFRFYTLNGEIHPDFESHRGKPFCLQIQLDKLSNLKGQPKDFTGTFFLPFGLGLVDKPDFESINEADSIDLQYLHKLKILPESTGLSYVRTLCGAELAASFCPGAKLLDLKLLRVLGIFTNLLDDSWDDDDLKGKLSWAVLIKFNKFVEDILDGIKIPEDEINSQFPPFHARHLHLLEWIYLNIIQDWKEFSQPVIRSFKSYIQINSLQGSREWKEKRMSNVNQFSDLLTNAELQLRWLNLGGILFFELALFDQRIYIPENIRNCQFFLYFLQLFGKQTALVNDIVSCRKDFHQQATCSAVVIRVRKGKEGLLDALETVLNKANKLTDDAVAAGKGLVELYPENKEVAEAVRVALNIVYGQFIWYANTLRYESKFVFNCVL